MDRKTVKVVEIGPRDGFQSIREPIPTDYKIKVIDGLAAAGYQKIQCTSFVSPTAIPQLADAAQVTRTSLERHPDVDFFALVPNYRGAQGAIEAGLKEICPVISLSVSHNQNNVRRTHEESIQEIARMRQDFPDVKITQDIATVFGCPFEGRMEIPPLLDLMGKFHDLGIRAFTLCDTIGVSYPQQVKAVLAATKKAFPDCELNIHIHDTRNMGVLNSYTALLCGADSVQASIGGLGGCPFAPGATGNTSSEDLIYMLHQEGYDTGINFKALLTL
ncbi:MAG: hydroxymethylglutaryl-CoA lyase, partial [Oscillospiraceae bacterium]